MIYLLVREFLPISQNLREFIHPLYLVFLDEFEFNSIVQHVFQTREISVDRSIASSLLLAPSYVPGKVVWIEGFEFHRSELHIKGSDAIPLSLPCTIAGLTVFLKISVGKFCQRDPSGIRTPGEPIFQLSPGSVASGA
jgi:hypothetical protein